MTAPRERIVGPLNLVLISVLFMMAFAVLRPDESTFSLTGEAQKPSQSGYVDALDIAYLKARRANGEHTAEDVRRAFDLLLLASRPADARQLSAVFPEVSLSDRALLQLDIEEAAERLRLAHATDAHANAMNAMHAVLSRLLAKPVLYRPEMLQRAINISRTMPQPELTASLYRALAGLEQGQESYWLRQCALALRKNESLPQARRCLIDARISIESMDNTVDRTEQLYAVIDTARALGEQKLAFEWTDVLVKQEPDGIRALALRLALALETGELERALKTAQHLIQLQPEDPQTHRQLAQLFEWTGDATAAAQQWQWMATHVSDEQSLQQSIRLSTLVLNPAAAARAAITLADEREPDATEIHHLVKLLELDGRPDAAAAALEDIMLRYGAKTTTLRILADLHRRHVNLEQALATWDRIAQLSGRGAEETVNRIEMHWRLNEPEAALALIDDLRDVPFSDTTTDYQLILLSELAWRYRLSWLAPRIMTALFQLEDREQLVLQGLRQLRAIVAICQGPLAVQQGQRLWQTTGESAIALFTMQQAYQIGDMNALDHFQRDTEQTRVLHQQPDYWTLLASIYKQQQNIVGARDAFEHALVLDPLDENALSEILWMRIEAGDKAGMRVFVDAHARTARTMSGLWAPMATALARLGESDASLAWFERLGDSISDDNELQQLYATTLEQTGHVVDAIEVRHSISRSEELVEPAVQKPLQASDPCR